MNFCRFVFLHALGCKASTQIHYQGTEAVEIDENLRKLRPPCLHHYVAYAVAALMALYLCSPQVLLT